ncbi:peptidoglycan-recognition protein SC2-like [Venturia canescens]|uniref:peptidoglycan-recognition protein SC2-like n=1 Tax=Venturia canescens TaxID=32260 RepID=UPI001C9D20E3|nr:peptidoglycan-recognition protein SC2-like [Venturia canescens]
MLALNIVSLICLPIICIEGQKSIIEVVENKTPEKFRGESEPNIISRTEWSAREQNRPKLALNGSVSYVILHHTTKNKCTSRSECIEAMRVVQNFDMDLHDRIDVSYNFYVGEDGNVYEGRGWDVAGSHTDFYSDRSIGICFIGDFRKHKPEPAAIKALEDLISYGVTLGKIDPHYHLYARNQVSDQSKPDSSELTELAKSLPGGTSYFDKHKYYVS